MSTAVAIKQYFAVSGSRFSNKDAAIIGPALQSLAEQGGVTARDVLDAARSSNSALHSYFEWNDKIAADHYRLEEARRMLRSITVKYADGDMVHLARAFQIEKAESYEHAPRKYQALSVLNGESAFAAKMMQSAIDDLRSWRRKYEPYEQIWQKFSDVFISVINQIGECEDEIGKYEETAELTDRAVTRLLEWKREFVDAHAIWNAWVEQMRFMIETIKDAEEVFCAADSKYRDCLRCGNSFFSAGAGNRLCAACRALPSEIEEVIA